MVRLLSCTEYSFLPIVVRVPCCLSFPLLATTSLRDSDLESSMLSRVYVLYSFHLQSLCITNTDMYPPAASVVAPPIRNEYRTIRTTT